MAEEATELLEAAARKGIPISEQVAYFKLGSGERVLRVPRLASVSHVDLIGLDDVQHPAIKPVSLEEAERLHLGAVRSRIDFTAPGALDAYGACLQMLESALQQATPATQRSRVSAARGALISVRLSEALLADIEREQELAQWHQDPGETKMAGLLRKLLEEAIDARQRRRPPLTKPGSTSNLVSPDDLVKCVDHYWTSEHLGLVPSRKVKNWLSMQAIDWGEPHGWPIRAAEDAEFRASLPRIAKWKQGRGGIVGFSFSLQANSDAYGTAQHFAREQGWSQAFPPGTRRW
jgi:hypothetical protein